MSKHPVIRLHLLLLAVSLLLSGLARAQVDLSDPEVTVPKAWNGLDRDGKALTVPAEYPDTDTLDSELAQAKFLRDVARDFRSADEILQAVWLQVNYHDGFEERYGRMKGRETLYAQNVDKVMRARVELAEATGKTQAALQWTNNPYFHAGEAFSLSVGMESLDEECAQAIFSKANMLWWVSKRTLLKGRLEQEPADSLAGLNAAQSSYVQEHFGRTSEELAQRVREALQDGNMAVISSLGLRATPALAALVLADLEGTRFSGQVDTLFALARVDPSGACRLAVDHFDDGGQSFRLRVLSMVETIQPFQGPNVWDYPQPFVEGNKLFYQPPRCQVPYWIDTIAKLASDRRTRARVYNFVDTIATRDAITPAMQSALIEALAESDERNAIEILVNVETGTPIQSAFPILEAAMQHESAQVRRTAARALVAYEESEALLAAVQDPDTDVRRSVAASLLFRTVPEPNFDYPRSAAQNSSKRIGPQVTSQTSEVLAKLLRDDDESIRQSAAQALSQLSWNFPNAEPYLAAARTHDPSITAFLLGANYPSEPVRQEVLSILAGSSSTAVLTELDSFLIYNADWRGRPQVWGPTLLSRISDPAQPLNGSEISQRLRRGNESTKDLMARLIRGELESTVGGVSVALLIALELRDPELLKYALSGSSTRVSDALNTFAGDSLVKMAELAMSSPEDGVEMTDRLGRFAIRRIDWSQGDPSAYFALLKKSSLNISARTSLAASMIASGAPNAADRAFEMLQNEPPKFWHEFQAASSIVWELEEDERLRIADRAIGIIDDAPTAALAVLRPALDSPEQARIARAMLDPRLHESYGVQSGTVLGQAVFQSLFTASDWSMEDQNLIVAAMNAPHSQLYLPAITAAQQLREESLLPVLGSLFRSSTDNEKQLSLVNAMGSYMTRSAGEELVQCLGAASDNNVRGMIQQQLSQIRSYLQEAEYWAGEEKRQATKTQAVLELVEMLDDKDAEIRAAAIDGLASFDAKEYLPRIIRMMKDESNIVQRAARNAVRVLQRGISTIEEPGGDSKGN